MGCSVGYRFMVAQLEGKTYLLAVDKPVEPDPVVVNRLVCLNHNIKSLPYKRYRVMKQNCITIPFLTQRDDTHKGFLFKNVRSETFLLKDYPYYSL